MVAVLHALHRCLTLCCLHGLLRQRKVKTPYTPVPGRLLYIPASCLPYHISGYTTRTHELLRALVNAGGDVHALCRPGYPWDRADTLCAPPKGESTMVDGVRYAHLPHPSKNRLLVQYAAQAAPRIARYAAQHNIACIHAASNHTNALPALIAARRLGVPFHYEMRGLWELTRASRQPDFENSHNFNLGLEMEGLVATQADRVFVITEQLGAYARKRWGLPAHRIHLLPNCVDAARILPADPAEVVPNTIGYAGSLINYEGLDTLIAALSALIRQGRDIHLHIIGDGEARPLLESLIASFNLTSHVHLHGKMPPSDARALLARCAVVCIPRKPFKVCEIVPPIKLVEALALAKPVIVPDLPVMREELAGVDATFFFAAGNADDLARVVDMVLSRQDLAALGAQGRQHVLHRRQWQTYVSNILGCGQC